uniref:Secreted protein n=1 Tax=Steinernema glaseri TaxID=37863 RepID=A0A1I7ZJH0_9BILA
MQIKVPVLFSLALLLLAENVAAGNAFLGGDSDRCYLEDTPKPYGHVQCKAGYYETDSKRDGRFQSLMCCSSPSKWSDKEECYEQLGGIFDLECDSGYEQNSKWLTSRMYGAVWCCPEQ